MNNAQKTILTYQVGEVNQLKSELIRIESTIRNDVSVIRANELGRIIGRLEAWQHKQRKAITK